MTKRTRMNVYFDPELLKQVEALSLRRKVSKSAIIEAAVASFLSGDTADRLGAAMSRRLDRLGLRLDLPGDRDLAGDGRRDACRRRRGPRCGFGGRGGGRRLATGDRFLKELSRDVDSTGVSSLQEQVGVNGDQP